MSLLDKAKKFVTDVVREANAPTPQTLPEYVTSGFTIEPEKGWFLTHPGLNRKRRRKLEADLRHAHPHDMLTANGRKPFRAAVSKAKVRQVLQETPSNFPMRLLPFNVGPNRKAYCLEPEYQQVMEQYNQIVRNAQDTPATPTLNV